MSISNKLNQSISSNCVRNNGDSFLPPVRKTRPSSSTERSSWGKVLTNQRKMSLEAPNQELTKSTVGRKFEKEKYCPRLSRTFRSLGDTTMEVNLSNKLKDKPERQIDLVKIMRFVCLFI